MRVLTMKMIKNKIKKNAKYNNCYLKQMDISNYLNENTKNYVRQWKR